MMTEIKLNELMTMEHIVRVHADGTTVTDAPVGMRAPELLDEVITDGSAFPWELISYGYTLQYGARHGAILQNSEYIGVRLARDILARPGYYVVIPALWSCRSDMCPPDCEETTMEGWAVAFMETEAYPQSYFMDKASIGT